jgi:predicted acyl esterase
MQAEQAQPEDFLLVDEVPDVGTREPRARWTGATFVERPLVPGEPAELVVELLPVSHLFSKGHRIRLALAGGDRDQFAPIPGASAHWQVERSADAASRLELPVVPRD